MVFAIFSIGYGDNKPETMMSILSTHDEYLLFINELKKETDDYIYWLYDIAQDLWDENINGDMIIAKLDIEGDDPQYGTTAKIIDHFEARGLNCLQDIYLELNEKTDNILDYLSNADNQIKIDVYIEGNQIVKNLRVTNADDLDVAFEEIYLTVNKELTTTCKARWSPVYINIDYPVNHKKRIFVIEQDNIEYNNNGSRRFLYPEAHMKKLKLKVDVLKPSIIKYMREGELPE